ncbi:ATP-binding protein [Collimonas humicola]|uniref:ATP-binding protein n=1 Tax=Collimonas humicola TaxID=2825886 RepID=UPI001B8C4A6C|nr:ATP-binding protein [Collimonas humicola]
MLTNHVERDFEISKHLLNAGSFLAISLVVVAFISAISIPAFFALWQRNYQVENDFLKLITKFNTEEVFTAAARSLSEKILHGKNIDSNQDAQIPLLLLSLLNEYSSEKVLKISDTLGTSTFEVIKSGALPPSINSVQMATLVTRLMMFDSAYWHDGKNKEQTFLVAANGNFAVFSKDIYAPRSATILRDEMEIILEHIKQTAVYAATALPRQIWAKRYVHPFTGEETLICFSPVYDKQGHIAAYVGTNVSARHLLDSSNATRLSSEEGIQLITQTGVIAASSGQIGLNPSRQSNAFTASFFGGATVSVNLAEATISFERPAHSLTWRVIYTIKIRNLFNAYIIFFLLLTALFLILTLAIFLGNRFIRLRIIAPARQRAAALEESEQFVRGVLSTAPVGLAVIDPAVPKLLISNPMYDQGINLIKTFGAENLAKLHSSLSNASPGQISIQLIQETLSNDDQRSYSVRTSQQTLHKNVALIFAVSDISEQKRAEAELLASRSAVESANKAKDVFLAMVSHELRTPLYGVLTSLELLTTTSLGESQRYFLDVMESSTRNLLELINDLLDFSKIDANKFTLSERSVHLIPELEAIGRACATRARLQGITFDWMLDPTLSPAVTTDPVRLAQIVTNLVSNAIKFTPSGFVALTAKLEGISDGRGQIAVTVQDSGIGIAASELENLFKPFSQIGSHEVHASGTGLGLSISRKLAALLGGEICVDSEKGRGSSFTLRLSLPWAESVLPQHQSNDLFAYHTTLKRRQWYLQSLIRQAGLTPIPASKEDNVGATISGVIAFADEAEEIGTPSRIVLIASSAPEVDNKVTQIGVQHICAFSQAHMIDCIRGQYLPGGLSPIPDAASDSAPFAFYVLVIDDHSVNGTILACQLEALGCLVDVYDNPEEALAAFDPDSHQLILTDMNMPGITGEQLAVRTKEIAVHVPIIAATADVAVEVSASNPIFDFVLIRPFSAKQLAAAINALVERGVLRGNASAFQATAQCRMPRPLGYDLRQKMTTLTNVDLERCSVAIQIADTQELFRLAHRMRGAFLAIDMADLAILCGHLEHAASTGCLDRAPLLLTEIKREWLVAQVPNHVTSLP